MSKHINALSSYQTCKGKYLKTEIDTNDKKIIWWAVGGRSTTDGVKYLTDNISKSMMAKRPLSYFGISPVTSPKR